MTRFISCSWFCLCLNLFVAVTCSQLPGCQKGRKQVSLPSVSACQRFIRLLEDPQYCNIDQSKDCCVVLAAALTNHCHCWKGLPKATYDLVNLLYQHCGHWHLADKIQSSDFKVFIGVLTGAAHAEQRQAGDESFSQCLTTFVCCLYLLVVLTVRETWGKEAQDHRVVFFSATPSNETLFDTLRM